MPTHTPTQRLILIALTAAARPLDTTEIAISIESTPRTVSDRCSVLCRDGELIRIKHGARTLYALPTAIASTTPTGADQQQ